MFSKSYSRGDRIPLLRRKPSVFSSNWLGRRRPGRAGDTWLLKAGADIELVDAKTGKPIRSFPLPASEAQCSQYGSWVRNPTDGHIWVSRSGTFAFVEYDLEGHELQSLVQERPAWFAPCVDPVPGGWPASVSYLWLEKGTQRLWVWVFATHPDYIAAHRANPGGTKKYTGPSYQYRLEVIDLGAHRVLFSQVLEGPSQIVPIGVPSLLVERFDDDGGGYKVMRATIVGESR
jgi:hypothetical protein